MGLLARNIAIILDASGDIDSRNPEGLLAANEGTWATIPEASWVEGVPATLDLADYYSLALSTYALVLDGAVSGVTLVGSVLTYSGTGSGEASYVVSATNTGVTVNYPGSFIVHIQAVSGADSIAPCKPTRLQASATAYNEVVISGDVPADIKSGAPLASNIDGIKLYRNGTPLTTIPVSGASVPEFVGVEIGTESPSPSFTQSNSDWLVTSAGIRIGQTADQCGLVYNPITGDAVAHVYVESFADVVNAFAKAALMARETLDAGSAFVMQLVFGDQTKGVKGEYRGTTGASAGNIVAALTAINWPCHLWLVRQGDTWTGFAGTGDSTPTQIFSTTQALAQTLYWGLATSSQSDGNTIDVQYRQAWVQQLPRWSHTDSTVSASTAYSYTASAEDASNNESAQSSAVSATTPAAPSDTTAPSVPSGLTLTANGQDQLVAAWSASTDASGIRGYVLSVSDTENGTYTPRTEVSGTTDTITGLSASTTKWAKVKAIDNAAAANESAFTAAVSATTDAAPPDPLTDVTILSVQALSQTALRFTIAAVPGAHHYGIRTATAQVGPFGRVTESDSTTTTIDVDQLGSGVAFVAGGTYWGQIRAFSSDESLSSPSWGTAVSGTTLETPAQGTILKAVNFDTDTVGAIPSNVSLSGDFWVPDGLSAVSSSHAREGTKSVRLHITKESTFAQQDALNNRAEMNLGVQPTYNQRRWVGFSIYIPSATVNNQGGGSDIVTQWVHHHGTTSSSALNPDLILYATSRFTIRHRYEGGDASIDCGAVTPNVWHDWVAEFIIHKTAGVVRIWQNGTLKYERIGNTVRNVVADEAAGYITKHGCYSYYYATTQNTYNASPSQREMWIDAIRHGDANSTYASVAPVGDRLGAS